MIFRDHSHSDTTASTLCPTPPLEDGETIYEYLAKLKHAVIHIKTDEPDNYDPHRIECDWVHLVYGDVMKMMPEDALELLSKHVTLSPSPKVQARTPLLYKLRLGSEGDVNEDKAIVY